MATLQDLLARAQALREETALGSISPERAGSIMYDTLQVINQMQLNGGSLVINKIYATVAAMEADTAPVSDLTGSALKPGQLVVIVTSDTSSADFGSVYRFDGIEDGASTWSLTGKIGSLPVADNLTTDNPSIPLSAAQGVVLEKNKARLTFVLTDLIFDVQYTDNRYINASNGAVQNLGTFFSFFEVPIPDGLSKLWPYSSYPTNTLCFRSIVFLNSNKEYLSGVTGSNAYYQNGVNIPANAVYFSVCFTKPTGTTFPDSYYIATEQGNPVYKYLGNDVLVQYQNIIGAPTVPTKTSQLQNDSGYITGENVATTTTEDTDIVDQTKRTNNRFIDPSTGAITTNNSFFAFLLLNVPNGVTTLWPYNSSASGIGYCARSVVFYDASEQFISGISGQASYVQNGINVPENAKYVSVCFNWSASTDPDTYYLATKQGNPTQKKLQSNISVGFGQIEGIPEPRPRIRLYPKTKLPCLSLQFDDCNLLGDSQVVEYLDMVGCFCDFAYIANPSYLGGQREKTYREWNKRGYGIQNHSVDGTIFNETNYNYNTAMAAMLTARKRLENANMVVNGFVCPSSQIAESFKPILAIQGAYAFTTATSDPSANGRSADPCDLHRYSMQSHSIAEIEAFIDAAIANDQIITLYGHTSDFGTTYSDVWNLAKVKTIVEYIIAKRDAGLLYFNNTDNCVKYYFGL